MPERAREVESIWVYLDGDDDLVVPPLTILDYSGRGKKGHYRIWARDDLVLTLAPNAHPIQIRLCFRGSYGHEGEHMLQVDMTKAEAVNA